MNLMKFTRSAALTKIDRVLKALEQATMTAHEVSEMLPMSQRHAQEYLNHMMAKRLIYIASWSRNVDHSDRMYPRPVYAAGNKRNAPKPAPLTKEQRKARAWAITKQDPERHTLHLLRKRKYRSDKKGPRPDAASAWIKPLPANDEMQEAA